MFAVTGYVCESEVKLETRGRAERSTPRRCPSLSARREADGGAESVTARRQETGIDQALESVLYAPAMNDMRLYNGNNIKCLLFGSKTSARRRRRRG